MKACSVSSPILLDGEAIYAQLSATLRQYVVIETVTTIDSTNDYLKQLPRTKLTTPYYFCLAEQQTAGRGRASGRPWHSPFGQNLYFSCRCPLFQHREALSLVVGLVLMRVVERYVGAGGVTFKWPNDLLWQGRKISGILVELLTRGARCDAVIGIGLNVNMVQSEGKIDQPWVSLCQIIGQSVDRNRLVAELITELLTTMRAFHQFGLAPFRAALQTKLGLPHAAIPPFHHEMDDPG